MDDKNLQLLRILLARLERISADSYWAHLASGVRGAMLRVMDKIDRGGSVPGPDMKRMIDAGFNILREAAAEHGRQSRLTTTGDPQGRKIDAPDHNFRERISVSDLYTRNPKQIVMYTTDDCPDCLRARVFFESRGIEYLRVGLEGDDMAKEFVMQVNHGMRIVPTIIFPDGTLLAEPTLEELREKFTAP